MLIGLITAGLITAFLTILEQSILKIPNNIIDRVMLGNIILVVSTFLISSKLYRDKNN